jgi:hypothetical protein
MPVQQYYTKLLYYQETCVYSSISAASCRGAGAGSGAYANAGIGAVVGALGNAGSCTGAAGGAYCD